MNLSVYFVTKEATISLSNSASSTRNFGGGSSESFHASEINWQQYPASPSGTAHRQNARDQVSLQTGTSCDVPCYATRLRCSL